MTDLRLAAIVAARIAEFLGRPLDTAAMVRSVDPELYRERAASAAIG